MNDIQLGMYGHVYWSQSYIKALNASYVNGIDELVHSLCVALCAESEILTGH